MDGTYELVRFVTADPAASPDRPIPVTIADREHAQLLADARDLSGRLERRSEQRPSDSFRLAVSLMQHIVELIEAPHGREVRR